MDLELSGKKALVTGGSRGIGKQIARELSLEGVDVAIASRGIEALEATAKELAAETGRNIVPVQMDTGNNDSVIAGVAKAATELSGLDILVNNAAVVGGAPPLPLSGLTAETFFDDVNVKVMGYLRCAREAAPYMQEAGWGRIINISGMMARQVGSVIGSIRNVSVVAMSRNLAHELGPDGITVNTVHPGMTRTERTPGMLAAQAESRGISEEEAEAAMADGNAVKRIIDAREIAYIVTFLASPKAGNITGDVTAAGGGVGNAIWY